MELTQRKRKILQAVVEVYVQTAEPVGSHMLACRSDLGVSPATLRHEMADLESMGYLEQPHTSAGRIPSPVGYRLFVDELMNRHRLLEKEREALDAVTRIKMQALDRLLLEAGGLLSSLTQYPSYAMTLQAGAVRLLRLDLFATAPHTFVIVLVTDTHEVKNRVVRHTTEVLEDRVRALAALLNQRISGENLFDVTEETWTDIELQAAASAEYLPAVRAFLERLREEFDEREAVLTGQVQLLSHPEYRDIAKARRVLEYLSDRRALAALAPPVPPAVLALSGSGPAVQFIIGPEHAAEQMRDTSVVMTSYSIGEGLRGLIGVVGPTRMDYARLTSRLSYFARRLGAFLAGGEDKFREDEDNAIR